MTYMHHNYDFVRSKINIGQRNAFRFRSLRSNVIIKFSLFKFKYFNFVKPVNDSEPQCTIAHTSSFRVNAINFIVTLLVAVNVRWFSKWAKWRAIVMIAVERFQQQIDSICSQYVAHLLDNSWEASDNWFNCANDLTSSKLVIIVP